LLLPQAVVGTVVIAAHQMRNLLFFQHGVEEPSLDLVVQHEDLFELCHGTLLFFVIVPFI
jgi:hypothetical protein